MGNVFDQGLLELVQKYDFMKHPICGPLVEGGPEHLARKYDVEIAEGYVDACHLCFDVRRKLIERFPYELTPRQVYGLD